MTASVNAWTRNETLLKELGFSESSRFGVLTLVHPEYPKLVLLASERVSGRLDLFTEYEGYPMNTLGDPRNICLGIPDHDASFAETVTRSVVSHFITLKV